MECYSNKTDLFAEYDYELFEYVCNIRNSAHSNGVYKKDKKNHYFL